ncbi:MAG: glycosyltransferase [Ruminococcus sp.]|nr:glycosyltransferase [Ruminococcus sp.]
MKITVVCDVLGAENNGTTIAAMNLIRAMNKRGHEVTVVCSDEDKKGKEGYVVMPKLNLGPLNNYVSKNGVSLSRANKKVLEPVIKNSDVVHIMIPFMLGAAAVKLCRKYNIPVTAGFHCQAENFTSHIFMKDNSLANQITYNSIYRSVYRYVDAVHYPTEFIRNVFEQAVHKRTNGYVISNGVSERFKPIKTEKPPEFSNRFVILFSGRYSKEKSHSVLIDAAALSKHSREIQLVFAGDGPLKQKLKEQAKKLPNRPLFNFFPHAQMLNVLNYADLYVHPAEIEIEAIACMEALACGQVPIISDSPRSATVKFALDERNLFKNRDPEDLAKKIDFFIDNPDVLEEYRERYKGIVAEFSQKVCMDKMEKMFYEALR